MANTLRLSSAGRRAPAAPTTLTTPLADSPGPARQQSAAASRPRPSARWVSVERPGGRPRLEMAWTVPGPVSGAGRGTAGLAPAPRRPEADSGS